MQKNRITIEHAIWICKSREEVWNYMQDYAKRNLWDPAVLQASVLQTVPVRVVQLKTKGNNTITMTYKLDDKPVKTSLAITEVQSAFIESGGGSWIYEEEDNGTRWTQTNTILFKKKILLPVILPLFKWLFTYQTRKAMSNVKKILEKS